MESPVSPPTAEALDDQRPWPVTLAARSPWWVVSFVVHALVIAVIGVATISIERCDFNAPSALVIADMECEVRDGTGHWGSGSENVYIVVPPDILAKAELDGHFETINPDLPNTHEALGRAAAEMFHRVQGRDDEFGGGKLEPDFTEIQIGSGGGPCPGSGWGGGTGGGMGVDNGSAQGSFGQRNGAGRRLMVKRHGCGCRATESSCDLALNWLAEHQERDGHWDCIKNGADFHNDIAVTSLAALAFLGAGHSERVGTYKDNVRRAVGWLIAHQAEDGRFINPSDAGEYRGGGYPQAIATLALAEAAGMSRMPATKAAAQDAVDYCVAIQGADGGWRYRPGADGDLSVSAWFIMALKSARIAGLKVNRAAWERMNKFLDSVEIKGDTSQSFTPPSYYVYQPHYVGAPAPYRLSAIGNLARYFAGRKTDELRSSVDAFIAAGGAPQWGNDGEKADLYYWYYGTLCAFQTGGETWRVWNNALKAALIEHQCKDGVNKGSWPVAGAYSREWGRVGQTALSALCLEVYYAYVQLAPPDTDP